MDELFDGLGDFALELFDEDACCALDVLCLGAVEAGGLDEGFDFGEGGLREGLGCGEHAEEFGGGFVDADVGGLRGENGRDGELERVAVGECADDVGIGFAEGVEDRFYSLGGEGGFGFSGFDFGGDGFARGDLFCAWGGDAFDGGGALFRGEFLRGREAFGGLALGGCHVLSMAGNVVGRPRAFLLLVRRKGGRTRSHYFDR